MPKPEFDFTDGGTRADYLASSKGPMKFRDITERKVLHMESMKAKIESVVPVPGMESFIKRDRIKEYLNSYGFYMNNIIPDALHQIVKNIIHEAMAKVYVLQENEKRSTIYVKDLPLVLL